MSEPSSDALPPSAFKLLSESLARIEKRLDKLEDELNKRTAPKQWPWWGVGSFTVGLIALIAGFLMFALWTPLKNDIEATGRKIESDASAIDRKINSERDSLSRKIDADLSAMERRLTGEIEKHRREIETFEHQVNRENVWKFENDKNHREYYNAQLERIFKKVFLSDLPPYQAPTKPTP